MSTTAKLTLPTLTPESADQGVAQRLRDARARLGYVPNFYANVANSPGAFETYFLGYERFRAESGFTAPEQEVVFLVISRFHGCTYCMTAHSMVADKVSKVPRDVLAAVRAGNPLPDARLQALAEFTHTMVASRGRPTPQELESFLSAGYSERSVLEVILAIAVKTITNYTNHLFHTKNDPPFGPYTWEGTGED